jgi:HD-GYP domain-containing protein (c-di-GMP phosphodiesterase class II)
MADCFDPMVSERAYQEALSHEDAIAELLWCSGSQFDPEILNAFLTSLEIHGNPRLLAMEKGEGDALFEGIVEGAYSEEDLARLRPRTEGE